MVKQWLGTNWLQLGLVVTSTLGIFLAVIIYTRLAGLRSFSKMSSFDFAITVAVGSLMATVGASPSATLPDGVVSLGVLFGVQALIALLRRRFGFSKIVDNQPVVLMAGDRFLKENLHKARVTENDIRAKLREANVLSFGSVRAVILETTGDVNVLHGESALEVGIVQDVVDHEELAEQTEGGGMHARGESSG